MASRSTRARLVVSVLATVVILAPLAWLWQSSLVGSSYSVMSMGTVDYGGGPVGHAHGSTNRSITDFVVDDARKADVRVDLVAEQQNLTIGGRSIPGYTLNGTSPGPTITARQGELVEVHLRNASVKAGITLHWHGYDVVPAAMDGVAGVTQDEVAIGNEFIYRFPANQVGTYWYHSHQVSHEQVIGGLFGALVVLPKTDSSRAVDVTAAAHTYAGIKTINGVAGDLQVPAKQGELVRIRLINTDNGPIETWADTPFRVLAIDGYQVNAPTEVTDRSVTVTAGGRADLGVRMPSDGRGVRVQVSKGTAVLLGADAPPAPPQPAAALDLLSYGRPTDVSTTRSGADQASSVAGPACGGRSTGTSIPMFRCTWSGRARS